MGLGWIEFFYKFYYRLIFYAVYRNSIRFSWTRDESGWFVFELDWAIFFSQHIGLENSNLIFLWFWFVFGVEHYFRLY